MKEGIKANGKPTVAKTTRKAVGQISNHSRNGKANKGNGASTKAVRKTTKPAARPKSQPSRHHRSAATAKPRATFTDRELKELGFTVVPSSSLLDELQPEIDALAEERQRVVIITIAMFAALAIVLWLVRG